ncbi:MAG: hypothetical protein FWD15_05095, partial [Alphaproteobacteria bacterium]|nr:hypothetical protein [Alphaproteobacteria bacterium]
MIGRIYSTLSFDPIAAHPLALGFWHLVALAAFCFFPAYIVYAKQSLRRHTIYRACWLVFAVFFARVFMNVESIDLRHGTMVVFSNILYISVLVFAMIDLRDEKKNHARRKSFMATYVKHPLEALAVNTVWNFCRLLPPKWSSGFGGAVGRFVGRLNRKY